MFWGLIMEPGRCYSQSVTDSFHVSMAALDIANSGPEPTQVMCLFNGRNYLLCTLNKTDKLQCSLDLNFEAGTKVSFAANGKSHVHLTGYLTTLDIEGDSDDIEEEESKIEEDVIEKIKKRNKKTVDGEPPTKKSKVDKVENVTSTKLVEVEEEESSDSDFDIDNLMAEEEDLDDDEEDEADDSSEEEDGEEDDEESDLSEEDDEPVKPKQNGVAKKDKTPEKTPQKKNKNQQQKVDEIKKTPKQQPEPKAKSPKKGTVKGVIVEDLKEGNGELAKKGKTVFIYYEGRLKNSNKVFDSTNKGAGFSFRLGKNEVVPGFDFGIAGMKVGGKRRLTIPPGMAYGQKGSPPVIPPNSTLVFTVELKKVC